MFDVPSEIVINNYFDQYEWNRTSITKQYLNKTLQYLSILNTKYLQQLYYKLGIEWYYFNPSSITGNTIPLWYWYHHNGYYVNTDSIVTYTGTNPS